MTKPFWPLAINTWGDAERAAAHRVIDSGRLTMGEEVTAFEREFAAYIGSRHAVMTSSGSAANLLATAVAMERLGYTLHHDREAVVPAIAWATTYAPLHQHGFRLRVVDVDPRTLNVRRDDVSISMTKDTVMIVSCSVLGNPSPVDELRALADREGLFFIEDNCESMGASIGGKYCGTFGHIGTFSTFFSHHISTGEGGVLVTDDTKLYELALCLRAHGWTRNLPLGSTLRGHPEAPGEYQFVLPGYNLRPTEIAAAVGRVQLSRLPAMNFSRIVNWVQFLETFGEDDRWQIQWVGDGAVPFGFVLVFQTPALRAWAAERFEETGIEHRQVTGGCLTEHPVASHCYRWSSLKTPTNAQQVHHCGLFVGNHPMDLKIQISKMKEVLR